MRAKNENLAAKCSQTVRFIGVNLHGHENIANDILLSRDRHMNN